MSGLDKLRVVFAWIVIVAWLGSVTFQAVNPVYNPPPSVHGLILLVGGMLFGPSITGRNK